VRGIATVIALVAWMAGAARADPREEARALYDEGTRYYNLGDYGKAIQVWRRAYLLAPASPLLFNLGQAYRRNGDCKEAETVYRAYLREQPAVANAAEVEELIRDCRPRATRAATPPPPVAREVPSHAPEGDPGRPWRVAALASGGVAVVALGVGTFYGLRARSRWRDAQDDCTEATVCGARGYDLALEADDAAQVANVAIGIGLAAALTGVALWWWAPARTDRTAFRPSPGGVGWVVRF